MAAKRLLRLGLLVAIAAACALVLAWRPQAAAGEGGELYAGLAATPVPGGPGFYTVSGFEFHPLTPLMEWVYTGGGWLWNPHATSTGGYVASLALPHGATVTKFVVYYFDDSVEHDVQANLVKNGLDGSGSLNMASVQSSGTALAPGCMEDTTILYPIVNAQSNSYSAYVSLPPDMDGALIAVRIDYTYNANLPVIMRNP